MSNWIGTYEGKRVDLLNPTPEMITFQDIAVGLARMPRFAGHTHDFYSVAQHSVSCSKLVPPEHAIAALFHDASEAYLGDLPRPAKELCPMYRELEDRLMAVIAVRFEFPWPLPAIVKEVDNRMLVTEHELLQNPEPVWEDLQDVRGYGELDFEILCLGPTRAEIAFHKRWGELSHPELDMAPHGQVNSTKPFGNYSGGF